MISRQTARRIGYTLPSYGWGVGWGSKVLYMVARTNDLRWVGGERGGWGVGQGHLAYVDSCVPWRAGGVWGLLWQ